MRDDRVLPETRWTSLLVLAFLVPAVIILWFLPGETEELWAWTISPDLTPIFMGSVYGAGAYLLVRLYRSQQWHPFSAGVLGVATFAAVNLVVTLIHWERFNQGDAPFLAATAFYVWVALYVVSPPLIIALWLRNRRTDTVSPGPDEVIVPPPIRLAARGLAVGGFLGAAVFLLWPDGAIDLWPWELSPLTSRVLGASAGQVGVISLALSFDQRWSSWRVLVQTFLVATALLLVGAARGYNDFDEANPITWLYLGGLLGLALSLVFLYRSMEAGGGKRSRP